MTTRLPLRATFAIAALLGALAVPALAHASTWTEGTSSRAFSLASSGGLIVTTDTADPSLIVPYTATTVFDGASIEFEPRSIHLMPDGSMLVSCGKHGIILLISKTGHVLRQYTSSDIDGMSRPFDAWPTSDGGMLIVDRSDVQGEGRVFRVGPDLKPVWQYGGTSGLGAGQVFDPFTAEQLVGGHTLIADSLGYRVIEVDDVTGDIVWSFGEFKVSGNGDAHLDRPHSAEVLSNGDVLIADSENHRVIEVSRAKKIVWSYGTGVAGSGTGQLDQPNAATKLANGHYLISDTGNARVIEVDSSHHIVQAYGVAGHSPAGGVLSDPRTAVRLADGTTLIADLGNTRLAGYGFPTRREYIATSKVIDPSSAARKRFVSIKVGASVPTGSQISVGYSINSGAWNDLQGTALPSDAIGTNIRYRIRVVTGSGDAAPVIRDVSIGWVIAGASGSSTTTHTGTSGTHTGTTGSTTGAGSGTATTTVPGTSTALPQGTTGSGTTGSGGQAVGVSSTVSGWVMSEVKDDELDLTAAGTSGAGPGGRASSDSTVPGLAVLLAVYVLGVAWSPGARLTSAIVSRVVTATMAR